MRTAAILPIKAFEGAKQRLVAAPGMAGGTRRALAEAMFTDVLTALRRTKGIDEVIVVAVAGGPQEIARGHGAQVVDDDADAGQSPAAARGVAAAVALGFDRALLVPGDCPALDPGELDALLRRHTLQTSVVVIPDRHGTGTNGLLLAPPDALEPSFGDGSRERHEAAAAQAGSACVVDTDVPSLALDVDTPDDLAALRALLASRRGGAAHTRGMLNQLDRSGAR